ncbi:MAG: hypothetical protein IPN62_17735 [Flavobacteriales bacterium]|nr:hypothetical protein [Flavobacteriales bacterium]
MATAVLPNPAGRCGGGGNGTFHLHDAVNCWTWTARGAPPSSHRHGQVGGGHATAAAGTQPAAHPRHHHQRGGAHLLVDR